MALAVSSALPPPTPTRKSQPARLAASTPARTTATSGSWPTAKVVAATPSAWSRRTASSPRSGDLPVTTSACRPNPRVSSASFCAAPGPKTMRAAVANSEMIGVMARP